MNARSPSPFSVAPTPFDDIRQMFLTAWRTAVATMTPEQAAAELEATASAMGQLAWLEGRHGG